MLLGNINLPNDWYSLRLNQKTKLFVNVKQQIASLAPVFEMR
jgi:hypothetical protein